MGETREHGLCQSTWCGETSHHFGRQLWDTQRSQVNESPEPSANNALSKDGTWYLRPEK